MKFLFAIAFALMPLHAQTIGVEDFTYANGPIAGQTGGSGFNYDHFDEEVTASTSDWDNVTAVPQIQSYALLTNNSAAKREYNGPVEGTGSVANDGQDDHERSGAIRDVGRVFYRFQIQRSAGATWSGASSYSFATERAFFGVPSTANPASSLLEFGMEWSGGRYYTGIAADNGLHTVIGVLDYDHDLIALWLDPDSADFYNVSDGSNSSDASGPYTEGDWSTALRFASGGATTWDNLTVALDPMSVGLASGLVDVDGDGLPGSWELANGLDDNDDGSINPDNGASGDPDGDGLINLDELANGTDPQDSDSDDDGFNDGWELLSGSNPLNASSFPGAQPAPDLIGVEDFEYPDGPIADKNGGRHWDFDNSTENDPFFGHTSTNSDWDALDGAPHVTSGKLVTQNSSAKREHNGPDEGSGVGTDESIGAISDHNPFDQGVLYYRFEMTRRVGSTWAGASTFDFGSEILLFGVPDAANPGSGNREFAIHNVLTDTHAYSNLQPVDNQTYTLVARLDYGTNQASLYVDPNLSLAEGANTVDATMGYGLENWTTGIRLGSGGSGDVEWDRVRAGTSWEAMADSPPLAEDDAIEIPANTKARLEVTANDSGEYHSPSLTILTPPTFGTATPSPDGTVLYEHTSGAPASDSFVYELSDQSGAVSDTATATITFTGAPRFDTDFVAMPAAPPATALTIESAFSGLTFSSPHDFSPIPGDGEKLLVTEGDGRVYLLPDIRVASPTKILILDISGQVFHDNNEMAMKGITAHPDWASNGYIYVTYNTTAGTVRLSRFTCLTTAPFTAGSEQILIDQPNPGSIHGISTCKFGADGYLYVGFGDGGSQSDIYDNSQHIDKNLWSCVIRIDIDKKPGNLEPNPDPDIPRDGGGDAYFSIPADNPFVGANSFNGISLNPSEVRTEIYVAGLRNPWQFSPEDSDLNGVVDEIWVGDVGRADREEVGVYTPGQNGGWGWYEGTLPGERSGDLLNGASEAAATLTPPIWDYPHSGGTFGGSAIIGGFIYRGAALPSLAGKYMCADYISGNIWSITRGGAPGLPPTVARLGGEQAIVALTTDPSNGDILLLDRGGTGETPGVGRIRRLTKGTAATGVDPSFPQTLSQTNFFADLSDLSANPGAIFYEPNLTFWSDFAEKSRWFLLNDSSATVGYFQDSPWTFPAGMIWVKHFDYPTAWESFNRTINGAVVSDRRPALGSPRRRVETRFLVRNSDSVYGVSYRWANLNAGSQFDAGLVDDNGEAFDIAITLDGSPTTVPWEIPSRSSCLTCHTPQAGQALSFNTRQLNTLGSIGGVSGNLLSQLNLSGYLTGFSDNPSTLPRHLRPDESTYSLEARVRSYLAVNCSYCHQSGGTGQGIWDGREHLTLAQTDLINGTTVDAPLFPGDLLVVPGNVNQSIIYNRAAAANGYSRMPPLATNEVDLAGTQLLADWIASEVSTGTTYEAWRLAEFGSDTSPMGEPGANPDGDEGDNYYEWLTNTDPNNRTSIWRPTLQTTGGNAVLMFPGLGNRALTVLHSTDLNSWTPWTADGNDGIPLNPASMHSLSAPLLPEEFFRFQIEER